MIERPKHLRRLAADARIRLAERSPFSLTTKFATKLAAIAAIATTPSCSEDFMQSKVVNSTTVSTELAATADSAGNVTGAMDPTATSTQVLRAKGGAVSGSAIAMPFGALSIPVNVTIGEGETLTSSSSTQQMGMADNAATSAGPAVSFVPSTNVEAASPFTLAIPLGSPSLSLADTLGNQDNLVVMYKWMKVIDGVTSYEIGLLPRSLLTVGGTSVQFQTKKFGTFQLAITAVKVTAQIKKPTEEPPILKADAGNPLVGVWGSCNQSKISSSASDTGSGSGTTTTNAPTFFNPTTMPVGNSCKLGAGYQLKFNFSQPFASFGTAYDSKMVKLSRGIFDSFVSLGSLAGQNEIAIAAEYTNSTDIIQKTENIKISLPQGCYFQDDMGGPYSKYKTRSYHNIGIPSPQTINVGITQVYSNSDLPYSLGTSDGFGQGTPFRFVSGQPGMSIDFNAVYYAHFASTPVPRFSFTLNPDGYTSLINLGVTGAVSIMKLDFPMTTVAGNSEFYRSSGTNFSGSPEAFVFVAGPPGINFGKIYFSLYIDTQRTQISETYGGPPLNLNISGHVKIKKVANFGNASDYVSMNNNFAAGDLIIFSSISPGAGHTAGVLYRAGSPSAGGFTLRTESNTSVSQFTANGGGYIRKADCLDLGMWGTQIICDGTDPTASTTTYTPPPTNTATSGGGPDSLGIPSSKIMYEKDFVKFSQNTFMYSSGKFEGAACTGKMVSRREETGSYTLGAKAADGSFPITIKMLTSKATIFDPLAVAYANANPNSAGCGVNNWAPGVAVDLNGTSQCKEEPTDDKGPPDALKIEGNRILFRENGAYKTEGVMTKE
ncbi:MAG: hypothetical protein NTV34_20525 [Proteobacteria bacterium]|nr:hypothetical protein [Pseudomonadota bacterium]